MVTLKIPVVKALGYSSKGSLLFINAKDVPFALIPILKSGSMNNLQNPLQ